MSHKCAEINRIADAIKKRFPNYENIEPATELLSGKLYMNFNADKPSRGKMKTVDIPILLSKCPFCGESLE